MKGEDEIVRYVAEHGPVTCADLSRLWCVDRDNLGRRLKNLCPTRLRRELDPKRGYLYTVATEENPPDASEDLPEDFQALLVEYAEMTEGMRRLKSRHAELKKEIAEWVKRN